MNDYHIYSQGYEVGRHNGDSRSNPYEESSNILDWLEGFREGKAVYDRNEGKNV